MEFKKVQSLSPFAAQLEKLKKRYDAFKDMNHPELTREKFDVFYQSGSRVEYERLYFQRRGALLVSVLMYLIYGCSEYALQVERMLEIICSEFTWALPAHTDKNEKRPWRVIDLFAAETGEALSETCELMGDALSDDIRKKVKTELKRRIAKPFSEESFHWETAQHNWAAVCGGAVGMTFLYAFPEEFSGVEKRIESAMNAYLSGFGDDGISPEGLGYWNYGFWYFTAYAKLYEERCGKNILDSPKVKKIAMCQQNVFLRGNVAASYCDCPRTESFNSGLAHFYRNRFGEDIRLISTDLSDGIDDCFRFAEGIRAILWLDEKYIGTLDAPENESYYENVCWYFNRKKKFAFSARGGNNGESHNHNDVGSFIIADENGQYLADYGFGEYTRDYFSDKRYEHLCLSSRGHSVPIIDGCFQKDGAEFEAVIIRHGGGVFEIEMSGVYGKKELTSLRRRFEIGCDSVKLSDSFELENGEITERFVSVIKPEVRQDKIKIGKVTLICDEKPSISYEKLKSHSGQEDTLYFVDYPAGKRFDIEFVTE